MPGDGWAGAVPGVKWCGGRVQHRQRAARGTAFRHGSCGRCVPWGQRAARGTSLSRWVPGATGDGMGGRSRTLPRRAAGGALTGHRRREHVVETWRGTRSTRASGESARMHDRPRASLLTPATRRYSHTERRQTRDELVRDPVCRGHPFGYCRRPLHPRRSSCRLAIVCRSRPCARAARFLPRRSPSPSIVVCRHRSSFTLRQEAAVRCARLCGQARPTQDPACKPHVVM